MSNIVFVVADITSPGGIERSLSLLTDAFVKRGNKVKILSYFKSNEYILYSFNEQVEIKFLTEEKLSGRVGSLRRLFLFLKLIPAVRCFLKDISFDFIIGESFPVCFVLFCSKYRKKVVACEHVYYEYYSKYVSWLRARIYKTFFAVVALTNYECKQFLKQHSNVVTIPNILGFSPQKKALYSTKRIISVGRLENQKGYDLLLKAAKNIFLTRPDWELHIWGKGSQEQTLKKTCVDFQLESNVFFRGTTSDIWDEYLSASIYVLPSRYEGLPTVLIEAAACGLSIVAFDGPNRASEIVSKEEALLVQNGDIDGLTKALEKLMDDEQCRRYYSVVIGKIAERYSENVIYNKWKDLLKL